MEVQTEEVKQNGLQESAYLIWLCTYVCTNENKLRKDDT